MRTSLALVAALPLIIACQTTTSTTTAANERDLASASDLATLPIALEGPPDLLPPSDLPPGLAPPFALRDVNINSATFTKDVGTATLAGASIVVVFHWAS